MIRYLTSKDFVEKFNITEDNFGDDHSRTMISLYLTRHRVQKEHIYQTNGKYHLDLIYQSDDADSPDIGVEIKFRDGKDLQSTGYDTHMMDLPKYQCICDDYANKRFRKILFFSVWPCNGQIWVTDLTGKTPTFAKMNCNKYTHSGTAEDGQKTMKDVVLYRPDLITYYCYMYDDSTNLYNFYFSDEPINVDLLNAEMNKSNPVF